MAALFTPHLYLAGTEADYPAGTTWLARKDVNAKSPPKAGAYWSLKPVVVIDPKDTLIAQLRAEITLLNTTVADLRTVIKFQTPPVVTPPVQQIEGRIPYEELVNSYAWQDSSLGNARLAVYFSPLSDEEPFDSGVVAADPTPRQYFTFPRGHYLDSVVGFDGAGAPNPGEEPEIRVKAWGQPEFTLHKFTGEGYNQPFAYPLTSRIEVEYAYIYSPTPKNIYPVRLGFIGSYPSTRPAIARRLGRLDEQAGINSYNYTTLNSEFFASSLQGWNRARFYGQLYQILFDTDKPRFGPSYGPDWDAALKKWADLGKKAVFVLTGNSEAGAQSFVTGGYTLPGNPDADIYDIGRNASHHYGQDRWDKETYRWLMNVAFATAQRYGRKTWAASAIDIEQSPRYPNDTIQPKASALNYVDIVMVLNEAFKHWKGPEGHHSMKLCAFILAICWDGLNGAMGANVGVKGGDPTMKIGMGYAYDIDAGQLLELDYHLGEIYGRDSQGRSLWFPHVVETHGYPRDPVTGQGVAFEKSDAYAQTKACMDVLQRLHPATIYMQSEDGYTADPRATGVVPVSPGFPEGKASQYSYVAAKNGLSAPARRWAFTLGGMLHKAWLGVDLNTLYDDANHDTITEGINWDLVSGYGGTYSQTACWSMQALIAGYLPKSFNNPQLDPALPFVLVFEKAGSPNLTAVWGSDGITTPVGVSGTRYRFDPTTGAFASTGAVGSVTPSELPQFVLSL